MKVVRSCGITLSAALLWGQAFAGEALAAPGPVDGNLTFACGFLGACPPRAVPGGPDREVHPFRGSLGRPCGWRERPTPQGPRRVRMCY